MADREIINYAGNQQIYTKPAIDNLLAKKQDSLGKEVYSQAQIDDFLDKKQDKLPFAVYSQDQITALLKGKQDKLPVSVDPANPIGIDDLKVIAAGVQVGGTMFWPVFEKETRTLVSRSENNTHLPYKPSLGDPIEDPATYFEYWLGDRQHLVKVLDDEVELLISKDEPEGWWPLNGKAELRCEDYPYLAKFFGGTRNDDGTWNADGNNVADDWVNGKSANARIWLPYVQQTIIKAKY